MPPQRCVMRQLDTDWLVIGAGAMGMAFTDALVDHADVHVTMVDRRLAPGGHWHHAYPFVRLHQASQFYGVASTVLGAGSIQQDGPEAGLHERASLEEILDYYQRVLDQRLLPSGQVRFLGGWEWEPDGATNLVRSHETGERVEIRVRERVVDATWLAPTVPSTTPPPFNVSADAAVVSINELTGRTGAHSDHVIVGSGKTATDAIVWLLTNGVDADRVVWVRPREPWMLNRAMVQPNGAVAVGLAADTMAAAASATTADEMFLRMEAAGAMLRVDQAAVPTMAKTPTLAEWELDLLRSVERVVRMGHVIGVDGNEVVLDDGVVGLDGNSLVVHCAASGLSYPPMVPIWQRDRVRLQTIRAGFPCFCAALAGLVTATRPDDAERNRVCPPNVYGNSLAEWARMTSRGVEAMAVYGAEPDIAAWANGCALNPSRVRPEEVGSTALVAASTRLDEHREPGLARLKDFASAATHH